MLISFISQLVTHWLINTINTTLILSFLTHRPNVNWLISLALSILMKYNYVTQLTYL